MNGPREKAVMSNEANFSSTALGKRHGNGLGSTYFHFVNETLRKDSKIWDMFTRKEEYVPLFLDKFQRFPHYLSVNRNIFEPEVSKYLMENGLKIEYPEGKKFAVCLTHDIDIIHFTKKNILKGVGRSLLHCQIQDALKMPLFLNDNFNPLWNFKSIMDLEEKYDAKSTFYFMALDKSNLDFNYKIYDLRDELRSIADNGWEIGLHGGHEAFNSLKELQNEKLRLENASGKEIIGYRGHFLRFNVPKTWELLKEAGFKYDATFGYADCIGFRNGMCHPFRPFNLKKNDYIDILEIPLTIMDRTLLDYMRLDFKRAYEVVKLLVDSVEKHNGVITILWHNTYMTGDGLRMYKKILDYCLEKDAWMTSGASIEKWWNRQPGR